MITPVEKHFRNKRWLRVSAFAAALFGGALLVIHEATAPNLYLLVFVLFQIAMFTLIGLGIADWRLAKKYGIIDHGETNF